MLFYLTSIKFCRTFVLENCQSNAIRGFVFFSTRIGYTPTRPPPTPTFHYKAGRSLLFLCWYYTPPFVKSLPPIYSIYPYRSPLLLNKDTIKVSYMQTKNVKILHKKRETFLLPFLPSLKSINLTNSILLDQIYLCYTPREHSDKGLSLLSPTLYLLMSSP